ncbi:MAG: cell division protein FtsH, partial [Opitutales bacterium]|nr:cell division protein FtsH [Opitutales bacterium]
ISSGASSDIKSATSMARRMVCEWGMSSLGPVAFGENQQNLFLGREIARTQSISEATLQNIDREIRDIIDRQYERAEKIISENAEAHKKIAEALLEYETLDGVHVKEILEHGEIRTSVEYKPLSAVKDDAEEEKESENKPENVPATEQTDAPAAEPATESKP